MLDKNLPTSFKKIINNIEDISKNSVQACQENKIKNSSSSHSSNLNKNSDFLFNSGITNSINFNSDSNICIKESSKKLNSDNNAKEVSNLKCSVSYNAIDNINNEINNNFLRNEIASNYKNSSCSINRKHLINKCVRFNEDIKIHELVDDEDRKPMPLARMYYKDHVELSQLREEMKLIQQRILNNIEGKLTLGD